MTSKYVQIKLIGENGSYIQPIDDLLQALDGEVDDIRAGIVGTKISIELEVVDLVEPRLLGSSLLGCLAASTEAGLRGHDVFLVGYQGDGVCGFPVMASITDSAIDRSGMVWSSKKMTGRPPSTSTRQGSARPSPARPTAKRNTSCRVDAASIR